MYAHTTWPPPGGTTGAPNRAPRRSATAPDTLGRWGR